MKKVTLEENVDELNRFQDAVSQEQHMAVQGAKELTSAQPDKHKPQLNSIDFKTRLKIDELISHAIVDWMGEIHEQPKIMKSELAIVRLAERLKRLRPSEDGKSRDDIVAIFKSQDKDQNAQNAFQRFFGIKPPGQL